MFFGTWIINGALDLQDIPFFVGIVNGLILTSARQVGTQRSVIALLFLLCLGTSYYVMNTDAEDKSDVLVRLIFLSEEEKKKKKEAKEKEKSDRENRK